MRIDPHSVTDDAQSVIQHFTWRARVDFAQRRLHCEVTLRLQAPTAAATPLDLDARGLDVEAVTSAEGAPLRWAPLPTDAVLGTPLRVHLPAGVGALTLRYRTSAEASALQWLDAAQTHGGRQPYLFSQCQAIHARSLVPLQDTPSRRVTFDASLEVPAGLTAVMAAAPRPRGADGRFHFEMPQPIPPYLLAFAVGDLACKALSPRSQVWAEPGVLERAAWEFAEVERHLHAAEALFGPYDWERFDLLVMPPSFPYGGMENPRLTFLTPTLLAGDRSLVNVLAHELAHSWTGNLVTNTTAEHFWLNEGFTVFAERRILEALEGPEVAALHAALGRKELDAAVARFEAAGAPELTRLRTKLEGIDPDEAFSVVPYEKGYLFLRTLEVALGREAFDGLLQRWLAAHRFQAADTDDFLRHVEAQAPGLLARVDADRWLDGAGVPDNAPASGSSRLEALRRVVGTLPEVADTAAWSTAEWQLFLDATPRTLGPARLAELDARFSLSTSKNAEVLCAWLTLALQSGHLQVLPTAEAFVSQVGRMKYLKPLYAALPREDARRLFAANRARYHPIAQQVVAGLLAKP